MKNTVADSKWQGSIHSKLGFIQDKGGKTRVVAIVDVLTQSALEPVHKFLMDVVRCIPRDCTFDQDKGRRVIEEISATGVPMWSFDLSNATDRLPRAFAVQVLEPILGPNITNLLVKVLVDREFHFTKRDHNFVPALSHLERKKQFKRVEVSGKVRYSVGTPMGTLSCFTGFLAIPHHSIVQDCARSCGLPLPFSDYVILGDDIVIWNESVAKLYEKVMVSDLGVKISKAKTLIGRGIAEFAKSIFF